MNLVPTIYGLIAGLVTGPMILAAVTQAGAASELQGTKDVLRDGPSLAEFVDRIVTNRMREFRVPGAVVTVVRGDRVLVNKGYGFADLEDRRPVDPERTLFRIASVSKVFNAMAVMRLVDEGLIRYQRRREAPAPGGWFGTGHNRRRPDHVEGFADAYCRHPGIYPLQTWR